MASGQESHWLIKSPTVFMYMVFLTQSRPTGREPSLNIAGQPSCLAESLATVCATCSLVKVFEIERLPS